MLLHVLWIVNINSSLYRKLEIKKRINRILSLLFWVCLSLILLIMLSFKTSSTCFANLFRFNFSPPLVTKSRAILRVAEVENELRIPTTWRGWVNRRKMKDFQREKRTWWENEVKERFRLSTFTIDYCSSHANYRFTRISMCPPCFSSKRPVSAAKRTHVKSGALFEIKCQS